MKYRIAAIFGSGEQGNKTPVELKPLCFRLAKGDISLPVFCQQVFFRIQNILYVGGGCVVFVLKMEGFKIVASFSLSLFKGTN